MFDCGTCEREFTSQKARQQHLEKLNHKAARHACETCNKHRAEHAASQPNVAYFYCESEDCFEHFTVADELQQHAIEEHHYCYSCDRYLGNSNNVRQHLMSRYHRGYTVRCPYCYKTYEKASILANHIESSRCPGTALNRDRLYADVRRRDPNDVIARRLDHYQGFTPLEATERAYNGSRRGYDCYHCRRLFPTLRVLNSHLRSPAHQQTLYHCPNRRYGREFVTLTGAISHLESGTCGHMEFDMVQRAAQRYIHPHRVILA